jgi:hypothetical protein
MLKDVILFGPIESILKYMLAQYRSQAGDCTSLRATSEYWAGEMILWGWCFVRGTPFSGSNTRKLANDGV